MSRPSFDELLRRISNGDCMERPDVVHPLFAEMRSYKHRDILAMTLWFLAKCDTFASMKSQFNVPLSTMHGLVRQGVTALGRALLYGEGGNQPVVHFPSTVEEVTDVLAKGIGSTGGDLPQCIGAINGTHVEMRKPTLTEVSCLSSRGVSHVASLFAK
jgi:hypothetical protein